MANQYVNKLVKDGVTKFDLTNDTVTPATLAVGETAHNAAGNQITGTMKKEGNVNLSTSSVTLTDSSPTATVTLSNATGTVSIEYIGRNFTATLSNNRITLTRLSSNKETSRIYVIVNESASTSKCIKTIDVTNDGLVICTWADGTDEEIATMIQEHRDGLLDLTDYWSVGDIRTIPNKDTSIFTKSSFDLVLAEGTWDNNLFDILVDTDTEKVCTTTAYYSGYYYVKYKLDDIELLLNCFPESLTDKLTQFYVSTSYYGGKNTKITAAGTHVDKLYNAGIIVTKPSINFTRVSSTMKKGSQASVTYYSYYMSDSLKKSSEKGYNISSNIVALMRI